MLYKFSILRANKMEIESNYMYWTVWVSQIRYASARQVAQLRKAHTRGQAKSKQLSSYKLVSPLDPHQTLLIIQPNLIL